MPTPDVSIAFTALRSHPSCPPEVDTLQLQDDTNSTGSNVDEPRVINEQSGHESVSPIKIRLDDRERDGQAIEAGSVASTNTEAESRPEDHYAYPSHEDLGFALAPEEACTFSDSIALRKRPSYPSSFLRPGSKFVGTQTDKQIYSVEVQIQQVDMRQSTMCGYLTIDGLTPEFPSLTTFFDGEIVGPHYSFITKHSDWGASEKMDFAHWERFPSFLRLAKQAKNPEFYPKNSLQKEHVFMRWKERFLVPDHKVSEIQGASYEGFYYICFNQIQGSISGVYFHAKSDRYQSLDLRHVPDRGCLAAVEWS